MSMRREVEAVRANAGVWRRDDYTVLQVTGADAATWLQSQTTNDVAALVGGGGCLNTLLDRTGRIQAVFTTHRWHDEFWLVMEQSFVRPFMERVESHVFLEDVQVRNVGGQGVQIMVEGPRSLILLAQLGEKCPEETAAAFPVAPHAFAPVHLLGQDLLAFRMTESGLDGFLLLVEREAADAFYASLADYLLGQGACEVGEPVRHCLRVEGGMLRAGFELTGKEILNETPLADLAASDTKGCYPGQEVVTRLRAHGSPKRALVALVMEDKGTAFPPHGETLRIEGRHVGRIGGSTFSPTLNAWVALAYLDRKHRTPNVVPVFEGGKQTFQAKVRPLPAVEGKSRRSLAEQHYEKALSVFESDRENADETAIGLLEEAILLAPDFEDAFESLGVILHRTRHTDRAIHHMKVLAKLNPNSVMAHANLSVFYMTQGRIREAEEEKALAAQLERQQALDTRRTAHAAADQRDRRRREAAERIEMFLQVLEIDPEDPVAAMGIGSAHMQLEEYARALPYLKTAIRVNPDYSAAYLNLGKCLEFLGKTGEAGAVYQRGVEAAGRKGDFMPLREMERRMNTLKKAVES